MNDSLSLSQIEVSEWPMAELPHISATSLRMFKRCPEQYRRRYLLGEKVPPAANMIWGSADHAAIGYNLAQKIDTPPYYSWGVTGGITFTFGGVKVDRNAQVISTGWKPIRGLYAAGEMVGGLFHYNYPLGTGLMSGAVFGRIAGRSAAKS